MDKEKYIDNSWKAKMVENGIYKDSEITSEEKQIEEMAKVICKTVKKEELKHCEIHCNVDCLGISKELLKYYQPKLPEDSVVLTKEELNHKNYEIAYHTEREEMAKTAMFTLRQDTVNEIVKLLKEKDYKELADLIKLEFSVKARRYTVESLIAKACKETVEKFAKMLINNGERQSLAIEDKKGNICDRAYIIPQSHLKETLKQFGVETQE